MSKNASNNIFILLLGIITTIITAFILGALGVNSFIATIIGIVVGIGLYSTYLKRQGLGSSKKKTDLKPVTDKREVFYKSKGLSDEDITFFRKTMNTAKSQILQIEKNVNATGKLRAITNRHNTLHLIKVLFKDIVNEPDRLHEIDDFLYTDLPSLAALTKKYVTINNHEAKSKETFDVLDKSAKIIDNVCQEIADDYMNFRSIDITKLADEVDLAKMRLKRDGSSIEEDEI